MSKSEDRCVGPPILRRRSPRWIALWLGLMPAGVARCFAADQPPVQAPTAGAAVVLDLDVREVPADAPQKAESAPAKPANKKGSILGAIVEAFGGDDPANTQEIEDQTVRNQEDQFRPKFQQLLYVELSFVRRVCKPNAKSFADLAKAATADLRVPLKEFAVTMARQGIAPNPCPKVRQRLMPIVEAKLGPEKARLYRQECDWRADARKHAVVVNLVATLDDRLLLTAQQRAKLLQSFSANYESHWDCCVELLVSDFQAGLPSIQDRSIVPLLDQRQKRMWQQITKQDFAERYDVADVLLNSLPGDFPEIQEIARIAGEVHHGR